MYNTVQFIGSFVGGIFSGVLWGLNSYLPAASIIIVSLFGVLVVRLMVKMVPGVQNPDEHNEAVHEIFVLEENSSQ